LSFANSYLSFLKKETGNRPLSLLDFMCYYIRVHHNSALRVCDLMVRMNIKDIFSKRKKHKSSLRFIMKSAVFRLALLMFIIIVPVCILTMLMSGNAIRMAENQVSSDIREALNLNMNQIDLYLQNIGRRLYTVSRENDDYARLMKTGTDNSYADGQIPGGSLTTEAVNIDLIHAYLRLNGVFSDILSEYTWADNVMAYFPDYDYFVSGSSVLSQSAKEVFLEETENPERQGTWFVSGKDPQQLIGIFEYRNTFYGASFKLSEILENMRLEKSSNIVAFAKRDADNFKFLGREPELLQAAGTETDDRNSEDNSGIAVISVPVNDNNITVNGKRYIVLSSESAHSDLVLVDLVSREMLDQLLPGYMRILFVISIIFLLCIPILFIAFSKWLVRPVNILIDAINIVDQGNLDFRIDKRTGTYEFDLLNNNFNEMMDSVKDLKINVYEKELEKQDIRLQYLSQQIQPHFILNAMNIIYSYEPEEYDLIQKMVLCLSKYFRFIVNANSPYVRVKDELEHIENYLTIQKIRYGERIRFRVETDEAAANAVMPPLMVQNLVENVIKYALKDEGPVDVFVNAGEIMADGPDRKVNISIRDTGNGLKDETLELIRRFQETKIRQEGLGVGIQNTIERLELFFGADASFYAGRWNNDEGTEIILSFPMKKGNDDINIKSNNETEAAGKYESDNSG